MLERYNVKWVALDAEEFCARYISPPLASGRVVPAPPASPTTTFEDVAIARAAPSPDLADFLVGREPQWADVSDGFAIARSCERDIVNCLSSGEVRALIITGTAGNGKSTVMRRLALSLQAAGKRVLWLRDDAPGTLAEIRAAALAEPADAAVFIDHAQRSGGRVWN